MAPLFTFPAKSLPCGVGSSAVPLETLMYAAHPSSQTMTDLFFVESVTVLITDSLDSVRLIRLPVSSYSRIVLVVEVHAESTAAKTPQRKKKNVYAFSVLSEYCYFMLRGDKRKSGKVPFFVGLIIYFP